MNITKCTECGLRKQLVNSTCFKCRLSLVSTAEISSYVLSLKLLVGIIIILVLMGGLAYRKSYTEERIAQIKAETDKYYSFITPTPAQLRQNSAEKAKTKLNVKNMAESRRKYAVGMQAMTDESKSSSYTIRNVRYTTEGSNNDILVLTADGVSYDDCKFLASSEYGKNAARIGFQKLTCRNSATDDEWSVSLYF